MIAPLNVRRRQKMDPSPEAAANRARAARSGVAGRDLLPDEHVVGYIAKVPMIATIDTSDLELEELINTAKLRFGCDEFVPAGTYKKPK